MSEKRFFPFRAFNSRERRRLAIWCCFGFALCCLVACGTAEPPPTPTLSPLARTGQQVFARECGSCHSTSPDVVIVGPSLAGVASRADQRVPEQDGRTYLYTSILRPNAFVVAGFEQLMPENFGKTLTGEEVDAVVAYLQTLE